MDMGCGDIYTKRVHDMNALFHIHLCIPMRVFHFCINFTCKGNRDELKEGQQLGVAMDSTGDRFIVSLTIRVLGGQNDSSCSLCVVRPESQQLLTVCCEARMTAAVHCVSVFYFRCAGIDIVMTSSMKQEVYVSCRTGI